MARKGLPKKYAKMGFKRGWRAFKAAKRKRSTSRTRKRTPIRASPRRNMARRKMVIPHPSITGMAAGFSLFDDLNGGDAGRSVIDLVVGQNPSYNLALKQLSHNAQSLVKTPSGRTSLLQAVGIAAIGAWARKALPATKLGGSKIYFRP